MELIRKPVREEQDGNFSVGNFLFTIIPYWPYFIALIVTALGIAWLSMQFITPMYQTSARLLFRDDKKGSQESKSFEALDVISPRKTVDNEIEVIQSRDLLTSVVQDLSLYAPVFQKGTFRDELVYGNSPLIISSNVPENLSLSKKIYFEVKGDGVEINRVVYPLNKLVRTPYGNLRFNLNPRFAGNTHIQTNLYFMIIPVRTAVSEVSANLKADLVSKLSSIIELVLKDENQVRGEDILTDLIKSYNRSIDEEKNQLAANTAKFISDRLTTVENNLLDIEHEQQNYRSNRGAIDISTQGKLFLENVSTNDQKLSEINMQLSVLNQIRRYVSSNNLANGIVPSTAGVADPGLTQMVKNVYELQIELESMRKTTGENNPVVVSYKDQIEKIKPQILQNLENQRRILEASRSNLSATNQNYSSTLTTMPATEKKLVDIDRELKIKSEIYTFLLQKKEETALSFISNGADSKVISKPESSEVPVSPKKKIIYGASLLIALLLAFGIITGKEKLRRNIMYQTDIEKLTRIPVIGEITSGDNDNPVAITLYDRSLISEQFRKLRATLASIGITGMKKRILVTSTISGEGKSFIAINLAMSLALTGKRVALLDFDLNNPTLHTKLKMNKGTGLTEYLKGQAEAEDIIQQATLNENLSFLSAGGHADNPSELILSARTEELLIYLDGLYDYIVLDVAPVGPISDAYVLTGLADATLYVVRHAYTPRIFVGRIDKNNRLNKLHNVAIVFNDVSNRSFSNYGYGYGYGSLYGSRNEQNRLNGPVK